MKRFISVILVLVMILTLIPMTAMAATTRTVDFVARDYYDNRIVYDVEYAIYDSNGRYMGTADRYNTARLEDGYYTIYAYKDNYRVGEQNIRVTRDETIDIVLSRYYDGYYGEIKIWNINVYPNYVTGKTEPHATVTLYRNGGYKSSIKADSNGYFEISNDFGIYGEPYYKGYRIYPTTNTSTRVSGTTTANTPVVVYDGYGNFLGSTVSDSKGYYSINHRSVSNPVAKVVYRDYYYDDDYYYYNGKYYGYYDLSDYYLIADKDNRSSGRYYLSGEYVNGEYHYKDGKVTSPTITEANPGGVFVKGVGATPYSTVAVIDSNGVELGSTILGGDGKFSIRIIRPLRQGETLTITTSHPRHITDVISHKVSGVYVNYYNYKNKFKIGEKRYVQTVNGKENIKYMDTVPYITNGRTMLPVRFVAESLDYNVTFDPETFNAVFIKGTDSLVINLWSRDFYVNGMKHTLSVDPITVDGRIMLPVSELGRALGLTHGNVGEGKNIEWDQVNKEVIIQITK